ncbi:MAG: response regulator [Chthoniobacterales bacterium]
MNAGISEASRNLRILFVEDHGESRAVVAKLLEHSGHNVVVADCSGTALDRLSEGQFDVLLSDIGLPDGSGYALVAEVKKRQPAMKAIALTGFVTEQDLQFSKIAGFDFHLTKPVDFHELRTALAQSA